MKEICYVLAFVSTAAAIGSGAIVGADIPNLWHRPDFIQNFAHNVLALVIVIAVVADGIAVAVSRR